MSSLEITNLLIFSINIHQLLRKKIFSSILRVKKQGQ